MSGICVLTTGIITTFKLKLVTAIIIIKVEIRFFFSTALLCIPTSVCQFSAFEHCDTMSI